MCPEQHPNPYQHLTHVMVFDESRVEPGGRANHIRAQCRAIQHPEKANILRYLKSFEPVAICMGSFRDELSPQREMIGEPNLRTDGKYLWSDDLVFYVEKYNFELPPGFVEHMHSKKWKGG